MLQQLINRLHKHCPFRREPDKNAGARSLVLDLEEENKRLLRELGALEEVERILKRKEGTHYHE